MSADYLNKERDRTPVEREKQDALYAAAIAEHGGAIRRLARGYEADAEKQRDLAQEMHLQLWVSLRSFDQRCSLRTWVYRVGHNVGASHVARSRRVASRLVDLESLQSEVTAIDGAGQMDQRMAADVLLTLIRRLKPLDRQVILLHLEGESAAQIAEVSGISAINVATKVHRIKKVLQRKYFEGGLHAGK